MSDRRHERLAIALLLYTAVIWGINVVMMKVMTEHFDTVLLSAIRMVAAFAFIAVICRLAGHRISRLTRSQLGWVAAAAALMIYAHQLMLTQGLAWSTATNGALALSLNPLLSVLFGALLFGERMHLAGAAGVLLGLLGAAVVVFNRSGTDLRFYGVGDVLLITAMLVYVVAGACIRRVTDHLHPLVIGFYMHLIGAAMLLLHAAFTEAFWDARSWAVGFAPWALIAVSALFSTALGSLAWNYGISRLGLGRTSMFINFLPVSGLAAAVFFLGEELRPAHGVGFALVLAGTWLTVNSRRSTASFTS